VSGPLKCMVLALLCLCMQVQIAQCCRIVHSKSPSLGTLHFEMLEKVPDDAVHDDYFHSGRQFYIAERPEIYDKNGKVTQRKQPPLYLYHVQVDAKAGLGRWVIGAEFGSKTHAVAYIDSWAVTPYTTQAVNDNPDSAGSLWFIQKPRAGPDDPLAPTTVFLSDPSIQITCARHPREQELKPGEQALTFPAEPGIGDNTIYFDSSMKYQPHLSGFYVETARAAIFKGGLRSVYAHIRQNEQDSALFMYKMTDDMWMIGETPNVDNGLAFHDDGLLASTPGQLTSSHWRYVSNNARDGFTWNWDHGTVISNRVTYSVDSRGHEQAGEGAGEDEEVGAHGAKVEVKTFPHIYASLRYYRSLKFVPMGQEFLTTRNGMPLPTLGLGTGGLHHNDLRDIIRHAVEIGYRTFDLAREYDNEHIVANAIEEIEEVVGIRRHHLFLISKVWPTQLGVTPTRDAVQSSLRSLRTNYIDAYLLHWPSCDRKIDWHHCQDVVDPKGTWQQSWRALEREYAEGRVMNIGVSNFNLPLLLELGTHARTAVQMVQNHGEIGNDVAVDKDVRVWCRKRGVVYTPYAHQRNLKFLPEHLKESLEQIAEMTGRSANSVASRFFVQGGASIIPRSSNLQHLKENADVFSFKLEHNDMLDLGWDDHHISKRARDEL